MTGVISVKAESFWIIVQSFSLRAPRRVSTRGRGEDETGGMNFIDATTEGSLDPFEGA